MGLTFEQRQELKHAINQAKRAQIAKAHQQQGTCTGCGTTHDNYTDKCTVCTERRFRRKRREANTIPCLNCENRIPAESFRRRTLHQNVQLCYRCVTSICRSCGGPTDKITTGCRSCHSRHHKRRLQLMRKEQAA